MNEMAQAVLNDWIRCKDTFIKNDGSTASSSVNKMANDFLYYYEKALRAGRWVFSQEFFW